MAAVPLILDNKEYVVLPKKEYEALRLKAASKNSPARKLSLSQGKKMAHKILDETEYLMSSPANRERLLKSIKNIEERRNLIPLDEELIKKLVTKKKIVK